MDGMVEEGGGWGSPLEMGCKGCLCEAIRRVEGPNLEQGQPRRKLEPSRMHEHATEANPS